jgi:hypothetical protein
VAVAVGVARFAADLDALYFASQRTNTSVLNLKALGVAAENTGSNAGEAQGAIESLAAFMRNNAGGRGWIHAALGVDTEDGNGKLRDTADILIDIGKAFANMSTARAHLNAQKLGIPDNLMLAMRSGDLEKELNKARDALKNVNLKEDAERARQFSEALHLIEVRFDAIKVKLESGLLKAFQPDIDKFGNWLDKHSGQIASLAGEAATDLGKASAIIIPILSKIAEGWRDIYHAMKDVGEWVNDKLPQTDADAIGKAFGGMLDWLGIRKQVDQMLGSGNTANLPDPDKGTTALDMLGIHNQGDTANGGASNASATGGSDSGGGHSATTELLLNANRAIGAWMLESMRTLGSFGAKADMAFGDWAIAQIQSLIPGKDLVRAELYRYGLSDDRANGVLTNLVMESNLDPKAVGDHGLAYGIAQWHKAGQDQFKKWAGFDIHQSTLMQQLRFLEHDLDQDSVTKNMLFNSNSSRQAAEIFSLRYERPAGGQGEAERRGAAAVNMSQHTEVHVTGSDPHATGRAVASEQARVNADLTRNLISAVN